MYLDAKVEDYIVDIIFATREPAMYKSAPPRKTIEYGAHPSKTTSISPKPLRSKPSWKVAPYVTPRMSKTIGLDVLRHRIVCTHEAEARDMTLGRYRPSRFLITWMFLEPT
ncbi:MAG: hypothetical protein R3C68_06125 [Myxococcota bacterium]